MPTLVTGTGTWARPLPHDDASRWSSGEFVPPPETLPLDRGIPLEESLAGDPKRSLIGRQCASLTGYLGLGAKGRHSCDPGLTETHCGATRL
jgi:hypothetical protein